MGGPRGPPADITNGVQFSPQRAAVRAVAMRKLAHELDDVADLALPLGRTKKISSAWASGSFSIR